MSSNNLYLINAFDKDNNQNFCHLRVFDIYYGAEYK